MSHRLPVAGPTVWVVVCLMSFIAASALAGQRILLPGVRSEPGVADTLQQASLSAAAGTVLAAQPCSEREPNEQPSAATPFSIPAQCSGSVSETDLSSIKLEYESGSDGIEDLFVLTLPAPAQLTLDLSYSTSTADLDLFLFTYISNKVRFVATATHDTDGTAERIELSSPLAAGTYYVGVSAYHGSSPYTLSASAPGYSETCTPDSTTVCLNKGRFRVQADWQTSDGKSGKGQSVLLTPDTGYFWFFDSTNVEVILKMLDACSYNNRFWVFAAGMTDVYVKLRITDTVTGTPKEYTNPLGTAYKAVNDTGAFATCTGNCTFSVSPTTQQMAASGGTGSVSVTTASGCGWTAASSTSWITLTSGSSGTGNGTVGYSVASNTSTTARTGTMLVAGTTVTVTQAAGAATCTYTVSPTSQQLSASAGTGSVSVTTPAGCTWNAATTASWITITGGSSGTGNGSVSYSVTANADASNRTGTITVADKSVSITQAGNTASCTYTLGYATKSFGWCGADSSVELTTQSGCSWSVASTAPWLTPIAASGKGSATVSYLVAANTGSSSRQATLTIGPQTATITQDGKTLNGTYDGVWSGTTNTSRPVTACVANNAIQSLRITVRLSAGGSFTCETPLARMNPMPISGSSFTGSLSAYTEVSNAFTTVTGSFPTSTTMSGTWIAFTDNWFVFCGSSLAFGTGGTTLSAGSFTATKQ